MSLTTWHPPPITHVGGFASHTSNGDYGRWSNIPSSHHYSPVALTTPSSPWQSRKFSASDNRDSDIFGSNGTLSFGRQPETSNSNITNITVSDRTSYPFASEVRKSLLSSNNNNNKNDTKTVMYTYTDPTTFSSNNKLSTSAYTPELYSTNESSSPSYKSNYTTTVNTTVLPWNQNSLSSNVTESQKEPAASSWRSVKPVTNSTSGLGTSAYITEPSATRGYELYSDSSSLGRPSPSVSTSLYTTSAPGKGSKSLHRSSSFHGPSSTSSALDSTVSPYNSVSSRTVKDKLDSWGNDRQNASIVNSVIPYTSRDSLPSSNNKDTAYSLANGRNHITYRAASEPREHSNSLSSSTRPDSYGIPKPHTYESYNHGLGLSRPTSGAGHGYGTLDKSTTSLQQRLDELNLGNTLISSPSGSSALATKLRAPESPRSLLIPLSPRASRKQIAASDWDRYLSNDRSATAPSSTDKAQSNDHFSFEQRFKSATTTRRPTPKSILKKKSAYETVSGGESWKSYFQENEFTGYGLYRQNTMPTMRHSSRAPLPQLPRKSSGKRVHFAF